MNEMPVAGDPAPAFALPDDSGRVHRLADRAEADRLHAVRRVLLVG
jgi:peroxiredoxin